MLDLLGNNPTQLLGTFAFAGATAACLFSMRRPSVRDGRVWTFLALINCLFLIEMLFGLRYRLHDFATSVLIADGKYGGRGALQAVLIFSLMAVAFGLAIFVALRLRSSTAGERIAASIGIAVLALFAVEAISLHALDALFYRPLAAVLLIGWIWAAACAGTIAATFWR
jgi:hypothetical protein